MTDTPLRVGIIGAGGRVKGNYLPALRALAGRFTVAWVHARTADRLHAAVAPWEVPALATLDDAALAAVDVVAISVPPAQNAVVLRRLLPHAARLKIVIDTPVAGSIGQARLLWPLLKRFASVTVTEDFMNFPEFQLIREAVAAGAIGRVRHVVLDGMGHYYHGLALIRSFAGFAPVRSTSRIALGGDFAVARYRLAGGVDGAIVYPYRRYAGALGIVGDGGEIVSSEESLPFLRNRNVLRLAARRVDGAIAGFALAGASFHAEIALPQVARIVASPAEDRSDLNVMRSCGLMTVFESLLEPNLNRAYGPRNAIYDNFVSKFGMRLPLLFDPLALVGRDAITTTFGLIAR